MGSMQGDDISSLDNGDKGLDYNSIVRVFESMNNEMDAMKKASRSDARYLRGKKKISQDDIVDVPDSGGEHYPESPEGLNVPKNFVNEEPENIYDFVDMLREYLTEIGLQYDFDEDTLVVTFPDEHLALVIAIEVPENIITSSLYYIATKEMETITSVVMPREFRDFLPVLFEGFKHVQKNIKD